ncbi:hypothetical protein OIU76_028207 [Salix suchowensis]|nr:hypothetical protein OIU76_028207 [Salix suchowensis]
MLINDKKLVNHMQLYLFCDLMLDYATKYIEISLLDQMYAL